MNATSPINWEHLNQLFTVVICINATGQTVYASETARQKIPLLAEQPEFFEVFTLLRPAGAKTISDIGKHLNSLFLMKTVDNRFALRGQMMEIDWQGRQAFCFCGAPWLFWMNANCPDKKLGISDFSPQDSQLDQLFLMTTEQRMVSDLEHLNSDLQSAKQELEIAQEGKNAMFARMSHEMRTPLNGVVSALALLGDQKLSSQAQQLLSLANISSRNLLHVINYVLDVSKLEAGNDVLETESFEMAPLIQAVTDIVRARAVEKGLALKWYRSPELNRVYRGDRAKVRQCLLNFVTNAVKFTNSGSITVRVLPSFSRQAHRVRFEVEDSGPGISASDKRRIFEPFWTAGANSPDTERGTGLGLDLVRRYVDVMGGTLGVISQLNRGALFWFDIPMEPGDENVAVASNETIPDGVPKRFSGKVLLVDDNATNLLLGRMILESLGVSVQEAANGALAVEKVNETNFDLVIMDVDMPVMDGVLATTTIRRQFSRDALPIVALSAYTSFDEKERCLAAGMNDYLTKPIVRDQLAMHLSCWLTAESDETRPVVAGAIPSDADKDSNRSVSVAVDVLVDLRNQIGDAHLTTVLDQFEKEVRSRWEKLNSAFLNNDVPAMKREAHTLSSTCKSLGLIASAEIFRAFEDTLKAGLDVASDRVRELEMTLNQGVDDLARFRAEFRQ